MAHPISTIFKQVRLDSKFNAGKLLIYGAGNTGREVLAKLQASSFEVLGFIDQQFASKPNFHQMTVFSLENACQQFGAEMPVLIAVHNRDVDMVALIASIKQAGFKNVLTMFDYVITFPQDNTFRFFLTAPQHLSSHVDAASKFYEVLKDDKSKQVFINTLNFRLTGDYAACPTPEPERQYAPLDIPSWPQQLRMIDCGAYNGDTLSLYQQYGYQFEAVCAFEPDDRNYQQLTKNHSHLPALFVPCGVADTAKQVGFNQGAGEASRIDANGSTTVQMVSIDEMLPQWRPNHIKMDIEGGESAAIQGAQNTIRQYKPGLAISAYHLPADLWQLGLLIQAIAPVYDFYLRSHAYSSFDTVLYAMPK